MSSRDSELAGDEARPAQDATETATGSETRSPDDPALIPNETGAQVGDLPEKLRARYEIGDEIARGGLGRILSAYDSELGRRVAIKQLLRPGERAEARFVREARITARLEHPAIVPIHEAGRWPNGEPFYAMKLVNGRRLKEVAAEATTHAQRLALLPHLLAVADAIAYAHSEGVVHRDIKPSNLLVGAYGETVVIDWGLAKELSVDEDGASSPADDAAESQDVTRAGSVVGTPAYMSPEQARGDVVDERTDVYAIGAVIYSVLAGRAPHVADDSRRLVALVRDEAPTPIERCVPEVPRDLAAIVNRAMSREPGDRYRDAGELAADLRRFQEGQLVGAHRYSSWQLLGRWVRRHRGAVVVATVMTCLLLAGAVVSFTRITNERDRAEQQRVAAEHERAEAEELIDFMLRELHEKLELVGKLDLLELVAERASDYFAERPLDWSDPETANARATLYRNMGDVYVARGERGKATASYKKRLEISERLLETYPDRPGYSRNTGLAHLDLGDLHRSAGDLDAAMTDYRAYRDLLLQSLRQGAAEEHALREVLVAHHRIGAVLYQRGDSDGALAEFRAGVAISERLVALDPKDMQRQHDLAVNRSQIAFIHSSRGEGEIAKKLYTELAESYAPIAASDPNNAVFQRHKSLLDNNVGDALLAEKRTEEALDHYRRAMDTRRRIAELDPDNVNRQSDLAASYERVGAAYRALRKLDESHAAFSAAVDIRARLVELDPKSASARSWLAYSTVLASDVLRDRGDLVEALAGYDAASAIQRELLELDPSNVEWQAELAQSLDLAGDTLRGLGKRDQALDKYRASFALREAIVGIDPTPVHHRSLAVSHLGLAGVLAELGDEAEAVRHLDAAASIHEQHSKTASELYDAAAAFATAGAIDRAFDMLGRAVDAGYAQRRAAEDDPDLAALRADPRWATYAAKMAGD